MPYMGSSIRPSEELAAGMVEAPKEPCSICRVPCWGECCNCYAPTCDECSVKCSGCKSDNRFCIACAIKEGYAEIDGRQYCENCAGEIESEIEEARL